MSFKKILVGGSTLLGAAAAGLLTARAAAARRLHADVERLFAESNDVTPHLFRDHELEGQPAPVKRYFRHVLRDGHRYLRGLRLRHTGQFKTALEKDWVPITGEQYMTADPPGFIWQGTTRQFTARDEYVEGRGRLTVQLLGAVPVAAGQGPRYHQGELLRWLGESVLLPTALLPSDRITWQAVDDHAARLLLTHHGQTVSCLVRFNQHDEIEEWETVRYQGEGALLPWVGRCTQYRDWHGVRVPTVLEGSWVVDGHRQPYARFVVQELDYENLRPF